MMEKFDSIYADSINDDIEFDIIFNSEEDGLLIESTDPDLFFNEDGDEIDDVDDFDDDDDDDNDSKSESCKKESIKSMKDLDNLLEDDDFDDDEDDFDDEEFEDECGDIDTDDRRPSERINTVDDLDKDIYRRCSEKDREVFHSGETDFDNDESDVYPRQKYQTKDVRTVGDLDNATRFPIKEDDDDEDSKLIDKVENDGPEDEVTPDDFPRPEYNEVDNSFEIGRKLKEASTIEELDSAADHFANTSNMGLETEESIDPSSEESLNDGEDIDTVLGENFLFF